MKKQVRIFGLICLLAVLASLPGVMALSVSPGKVLFTGEEEHTARFTVHNDDSFAQEIQVTFEGALASALSGEPVVALQPGQEKTYIVTIDTPNLEPGEHEGLVVFTTEASTGQVGVSAQIVPTIIVRKSYPGAFLDYSWNVQSGKNPFFVTVLLENFGETGTQVTPQLLFDEYAQSYEGIFIGGNGNARETFEIEYPSPGSYDLSLVLLSSVDPTLNNKEATQTVHVGEPEISMQSVSGLFDDGIEKVDVTLNSQWNKPFRVTVGGTVETDDGVLHSLPLQEVEMDSSNTLSFFFEPQGTGSRKVTFNIDGGFFTADVSSTYATGETEVTKPTEILPEEIDLTRVFFYVVLVLLVILLIYRLFRVTISK